MVLTLGHSNRTLSDLVEVLGAHGVEVVVDVRNRPHNNFLPEFSKKRMKTRLVRQGIIYVFLGDELGQSPGRRATGDGVGGADLVGLERSDRFHKGLSWVLEECRHSRVCLFCGEADPYACHRHHLIGQNLLSRGVRVRHILWDGHVEEAAPDLFHRPL